MKNRDKNAVYIILAVVVAVAIALIYSSAVHTP